MSNEIDACHFEALKMALKQDATGYVLTLRIHPDELPEEIFRDFCGARYMVAMARINDDETHVVYRNRTKEAGMMCRERLFWEFLSDYTELYVRDEPLAVKTLYDICEIKSRVELNNSPKAKKAFDKLMEEYDEYSRKKCGI